MESDNGDGDFSCSGAQLLLVKAAGYAIVDDL
jgi:hypothetical protein